MNPLPFSAFSTHSQPPKDRFEAWRESIDVLFDLERLPSRDDALFHADLLVHRVGDMLLARLDSETARYLRPRKRIIQDGVDILMIQFFLEGEVLFRSGKQSTRATPGDLVVFDFAQPIDNVNTRFRHLSLLASRERLEACVPGIARYHGRPLPKDLPGVRILREHLLTVHHSAESVPDELSGHLSEATFSLVAAAFAQAEGISAKKSNPLPSSAGTALIPQIRRHIRTHLADTKLSPNAIGHQFGLSKAQLYRIMQPLGGIAAFIRDQRLHACRRDLRNPALRHLRIAEIAYKHGFSNITSFNRQFRQAFGCSPGDARNAPQNGPFMPHLLSAIDNDYKEWIHFITASGD